jgi:hypothetical protein
MLDWPIGTPTAGSGKADFGRRHVHQPTGYSIPERHRASRLAYRTENVVRNSLSLRWAAIAATLALAPIGAVVSTAQPAVAVIDGNSAGHLRGQVQIFVNDTYQCAGTLIAGNWVLTARHCFDNTGGNRDNSLVVAGDRRLNEGHEMEIAGVYKHPLQDAMLLNLWEQVPNASRMVVGYGLGYLPINGVPSISGWGTTVRGGVVPASFLQICAMRVTNNSMHHDYVGAGNSAMRMVNMGSGVLASGDSGAGVYYDNRIFGIHIADDETSEAYALTINPIADWIVLKSGVQQAGV